MTLAILAVPLARDLGIEFPGKAFRLPDVQSATEQFWLTPYREFFLELGEENIRVLAKRRALPLLLRGRLFLIQHGTFAAFVPPPEPLIETSQAYRPADGQPWPWDTFANVPGTRAIAVKRSGVLTKIVKSQFTPATDVLYNAHAIMQFTGLDPRRDELEDAAG